MATQSDSTNTGVIMTVVVVGAFAMISISMLLTALVRSERREVEATRPAHADLKGVAELRSGQKASLAAKAAWKSKEQGTITLPIERAMARVLAEYRANPTAASPAIPDGMRLTPEGKLVPLTKAQLELAAQKSGSVAPAVPPPAAATNNPGGTVSPSPTSPVAAPDVGVSSPTVAGQ